MFTLSYKVAFIHGYCDRNECRVQLGEGGLIKGPFPSIDSAKRYIRTAIKSGDFSPTLPTEGRQHA